MAETLKGKCLCGSVEVSATPKTEQMDACHCEMCRKWSGGPFLAISCGEDVRFSGEEHVSVYASSDWAERVFCKNCGTSLVWRLRNNGGDNHVSSQLFNDADHLPFKMQIFIDQKPDNYSFANDTAKMTGEEVFSMFASGDDGASSQ